MIEAIHQSSLNMALRCGEQFRRRYLLSQIIPPGVAAGRGTGVHAANKANLKYKIIKEKDLPTSDMKDAARDGFVNAFKYGVYLSDEDKPAKNRILNEALNDTIRLTELYANEVAPEIKPKEVERPFSIDVGLPLLLKGTIDIEQDKKVDDLKTAAKSWSDGQINKEIQPILYSFAHEFETGIKPVFNYHILVCLKNSTKRQIQSITATKRHYESLFAKIHMFHQMLKTGTFLPANPASWWCDAKWCGYYKSCKYVI